MMLSRWCSYFETFCKQHCQARLNWEWCNLLNLNSNSAPSCAKFAIKNIFKLSTMFSLHNRASSSMIYNQYVFLFSFLCLQLPWQTKYSEYHHISFDIFHIRAKLCFIFVQFCVFIVALTQFAFQLSAQRHPPLTNGGIGMLTLVQDQCQMSDKNSERDKKMGN